MDNLELTATVTKIDPRLGLSYDYEQSSAQRYAEIAGMYLDSGGCATWREKCTDKLVVSDRIKVTVNRANQVLRICKI